MHGQQRAILWVHSSDVGFRHFCAESQLEHRLRHFLSESLNGILFARVRYVRASRDGHVTIDIIDYVTVT